MKIIALEEHFVVPSVLQAWAAAPTAAEDWTASFGRGVLGDRLIDRGATRLQAMDDQGVDMQVLSLNTPGVQNLPPGDAVGLAREVNDVAAETVASNPDRFQGFATLPTPNAVAAAEELQRAVIDLRLKGAMLNGRTGSRNIDHPAFDDLYQVAADLRAPIYLHPQLPVMPVREAYYDGLGDQIDSLLAGFGLGWHFETGVQLLRLILSGTFDRHPDLQVIVGHFGELVLFYLERLELLEHMGVHLDRPLVDYFRQNVWYTGSGMLSQRYLRWTIEMVGVNRIMYATDYPFIDTGGGRARRFLEDTELTAQEKDGIAHENWERLTAHL